MTRYWEDIDVGETWEGGEFAFEAEEIKAFAARFDPRPTHLDEAAAEASIFEGLVASGAHTFAAWARLYLELTPDFATQAGVEMKNMRMVRAVRPGDRLSLRLSILSKRPYPMRPAFGLMESFHEILNQDGKRVTTIELHCLIERRPAAAAPAAAPGA